MNPEQDRTAREQKKADLAAAIGRELDRVRRFFKPGIKLTLVVRQPEVPGDGSLIVSDDDLDLALCELERRIDDEADANFATRMIARYERK